MQYDVKLDIISHKKYGRFYYDKNLKHINSMGQCEKYGPTSINSG